MSDQELGNLLRGGDLEWPRTSEDCPSLGELATLVGGQLSAARATEVRHHLASCEECLRLVGFLTRLERPQAEMPLAPESLMDRAKSLVEPEGATEPIAPRGWSSLVAAAGLAAMLVAALWLPRDAIDRSRQHRGRTEAAQRLFVSTPEEGVSVAGPPLVIEWQAVESGLFYQVVVTDSSGDLIWESRTSETKLELDAEPGLMPAGTYFVWIKALLPDGKTLESAPVGFSVRSGG